MSTSAKLFAKKCIKKVKGKYYIDIDKITPEINKLIDIEGGITWDGSFVCDFTLFVDHSLLLRHYEEPVINPESEVLGVVESMFLTGCDGVVAIDEYKKSKYRDAIDEAIEQDNI